MSQHPKLHSDYDLQQAFDHLGHRLFGDIWRYSDELHAEPGPMSSKHLIRETLRLREAVEKAQTSCDGLKNMLDIESDHDTQKALQVQLEKAQSRRYELQRELRDLPDPSRLDDENDTYGRRITVEDAILEALRGRVLEYWCHKGWLVDDRVWTRDHDQFGHSFEFSTIHYREGVDGKAVRFVRLDKAVFDDWIERVYPIEESLLMQGEKWLILQMQRPDNPKWRKRDYQDHMQTQYKFKVRQFLSLWDKYAPEHMTKPGRRKSGQ